MGARMRPYLSILAEVRIWIGPAEGDRELVSDQFAAAAGEDRGRLIKHARYYWLMLAESHLTRRLFGSMVRRIGTLAVATG
jgi:hypothetical protein